MNAKEYQLWCRRFDNHAEGVRDLALVFGLCSEAGEVAGEYEKWARKGADPLDSEAVATELGDVLWNVARLADELGYSLENLFEANIAKLLKRYEERGLPLNGAEAA